jgi:hypothetical protein
MPAHGYGLYQEDNPFVEAMLRMMEIFGLINRDSLPLGVPYLPGYSPSAVPGLSGLGGYPGMAGLPGLSPWSGIGGYPGMTGLSGMAPPYGLGGYPGAGQMPGPGGLVDPRLYGQGTGAQTGYLDGIWELSSGAVVVIRRSSARLYVSRERYQDFTIGYDQKRFWWTPRGGNTTTTYAYQMRDGRMVLRDTEGKMLLMRRRS